MPRPKELENMPVSRRREINLSARRVSIIGPRHFHEMLDSRQVKSAPYDT